MGQPTLSLGCLADRHSQLYEKESGIIATHGLCTLWDPNEGETR